jgi:hypothetical protein
MGQLDSLFNLLEFPEPVFMWVLAVAGRYVAESKYHVSEWAFLLFAVKSFQYAAYAPWHVGWAFVSHGSTCKRQTATTPQGDGDRFGEPWLKTDPAQTRAKERAVLNRLIRFTSMLRLQLQPRVARIRRGVKADFAQRAFGWLCWVEGRKAAAGCDRGVNPFPLVPASAALGIQVSL